MITPKVVRRFDLTKTTFIIPLRIETDDRMRNIITILIYLTRNFDTKIILRISGKPQINLIRYMFWKIALILISNSS